MPSKKILAQKQKAVKSLAEELKNAESVVFVDYQGLSVEQDTKMRKALRDENVKHRVAKNTQLLRAFEKNGITGLEDVLKGPTAITWSDDDVTAAPRLVKKFVDEFRKMAIKGGVVEGKLQELDTIVALSNIPSVEVLYGQLVSSLLFPITSLAMTLNALAEKAEEEGKENVRDLLVAKPTAGEAAEKAPAADAETKEEAPAE